jgi:acyl carrier protein phosphodiesterase
MQRLINAPIVWIEAISHLGKAIRYVTKYVGKAPAKFSNLKRYWQSHNWLTEHREKTVLAWRRGTYTVRRTCWRDLLQQRACDRWSWFQTEDGVWHFFRPEYSEGRYGMQRAPPTAPPAEGEH